MRNPVAPRLKLIQPRFAGERLCTALFHQERIGGGARLQINGEISPAQRCAPHNGDTQSHSDTDCAQVVHAGASRPAHETCTGTHSGETAAHTPVADQLAS